MRNNSLNFIPNQTIFTSRLPTTFGTFKSLIIITIIIIIIIIIIMMMMIIKMIDLFINHLSAI